MSTYNVTDQLQPTQTLIPLNIDKIKFVILHHAQANNCTWQEINSWHKENGWSCAGYNEFISKSGEVYILRGNNIGAQCLGYNSCSYGICVEGNYDTEQNMPLSQYNALVERIRYNLKRFPKGTTILPHSALVDTECPGKYFPLAKIMADGSTIQTDFMDTLNILVANGIIKNPDYWLKCNENGAMLNAEYVKILIENTAKVLKIKNG